MITLPHRFTLPLLLLAGCAECAPERVGGGAARLTVASAATVVQLVEGDERCGFSSAVEPEIEGSPGEEGLVRWRIEGCRIRRDEPEVSESCAGTTTSVRGTVEVTATRTVRGLLTGDPGRPVIPSDEGAVTIEVERATFDRFHVVRQDAPGDLEILSGALSFVASPRLASDTNGVCSVATPNVSFEDLVYDGAKGRITSGGRSFEVDLPASRFDAVVGELGDGRANRIDGEITVWDTTVELRSEPLAEGFDRAEWLGRYACDPALAQPVTFECTPPRRRIAEGAARLTIRLLGALTNLISADPRCGFPAVEPVVEGALGAGGGSARSEVEGCTLEFPVPTELSTDCSGVSTLVQGRARIDAVRRVEGWVTGDPNDPIIPGSRHPVTIELDADLTGLAVWRTSGEQTIEATGRISAVVAPTLAMDRSSGICSVPTPHVTFSRVRWSDAEVVLRSGGASLAFPIDDSLLEAQSGTRDRAINRVSGEMTAFEERFPLDLDLDPDFDPARFEESYACDPDLIVPESDRDCSIAERLVLGAARVLIATTGEIVGAANDNARCGFSDPEIEPDVEGGFFQDATLTLAISACEVAPAESVGCDQERTELGGSVIVDARRIVRGLRVGVPVVLPLDLVLPQEPDAVDVYLDRVQLEDAALRSPAVRATFAGGEIVALVHPVLAEEDGLLGLYRVPTPVAYFERVTATGISMTIEQSGRSIAVAIDQAALEAFNGSFGGRSNFLRGEVVAGGVRYPIGPTELDPAFDQSEFDESYACTENLASPVPPR